MPKICVQSPEVVMSGDINIHAQVAIVTKAKLDAISVQGNCECGDAPPVITDYVIVIDGSDSFNNKGGFPRIFVNSFESKKRFCIGVST